MIRGKSRVEIRATFNIVDDFIPEDRPRIVEENEWAEESVAMPHAYFLRANKELGNSPEVSPTPARRGGSSVEKAEAWRGRFCLSIQIPRHSSY